MLHQTRRSLQRRMAALSVFAVALPLAAANQDPNLPNFMKVDDHVFRGAQPTEQGILALAKLGIKTIVDLREVDERWTAEENIVKAAGMNYVSVPMRGMSSPTNEQIVKVLSLLTADSSGPVFVHCRRGADRTGTVIACYRIGHDQWDNQKALKEAKVMGMSMWERAMQHYVLDYKAASYNLASKPVPAAPAAAVAPGVAVP